MMQGTQTQAKGPWRPQGLSLQGIEFDKHGLLGSCGPVTQELLLVEGSISTASSFQSLLIASMISLSGLHALDG